MGHRTIVQKVCTACKPQSNGRVVVASGRTGRAVGQLSHPICCLLTMMLAWVAIQPVLVSAAEYAGSAACEGCHAYIYKKWKSTRHGSSISTGAQAERAGYPLPVARLGGQTPTIRTWADVAYVIGRRQRIAYIDHGGSVQDTSYHQRIDKWSSFPAKQMSDCGACHFTAFGRGPLHRDDPAVSGRWVEMNIGCESCHGPGRRHVESLEKADITVDASARLCGQCHTLVGKVLPVDDYQDTHDLVQVWNQDAHSTGTRFQSHSVFCAGCHSPFEGSFRASLDSTEERVFAEHKQLITCIGCHNPHELTNELYSRPQLILGPPLSPRIHIFRGDDNDFTTTDFEELTTIEQSCRQCHRGADRVELNHANATCSDCHNSFNRNRSLESRVFHDANYPELSCQPCHRDADHLMAILYRDPEFLEPKYIHNLSTLPAVAKKKHGLRYTELTYPRSGTVAGNYEDSPAVTHSNAHDTNLPAGDQVMRTAGLLDALLAGEPHRRLATDEKLAQLQANLKSSPENVQPYVALAVGYAHRGEHTAAHEIIDHVLSVTTPRMLLALPVDGAYQSEFQGFEIKGEPGEVAELLQGDALDPGTTASRLWIQGYLQINRRQYPEAARHLSAARKLRPGNPAFGIYLALAELGQKRYEPAIEALRRVLEKDPEDSTAKVGMAWVHLERQRFAPARRQLEQVLTAEPDNSAAHYLLGRGYLSQGDFERAARAFEASVSADATSLDGWYQLARTYRAGGQLAAAIAIYQQLIARVPARFELRYELAGVLKLASDSAAYQLQNARESTRSSGVSPGDWQGYLSNLVRSSNNYAQLALTQYAAALRVRPSDLDSVHQISEIYRRTGRLTQALTYFDWLSQREPETWLHRYRLGTVLIQLKRYDEAIEVLNRAVILAPAQGDIYFALGLAYVGAERMSEAARTLHQGTLYEPFNPGLYTNLGAVYAIDGRYEAARDALERSLELGSFPVPRLHLTYTNLALVHLAEGRKQKSIHALKNALHIFPEYTHAQELLESIEVLADRNPAEALFVNGFVFNDLLERFGEVTTVAFDNE